MIRQPFKPETNGMYNPMRQHRGVIMEALYTDEGLGTRGNPAPGCLEPKRNVDISQV
jgi:hypothetical protein